MKVIALHRGKRYALPGLAPTCCLGDVRNAVASALQVDAERVKLLHRGREMRDWQSLVSDLKPPLVFLVVLNDAEHAVKAPSYSLPSVAPRSSAAAVRSSADVRIGSIRVLDGLPNADVARRMLRQLAEDEGFLYCMRQKGWRVNVLKEMLPDGRVGVDPVCVLGYNRGRGMEISLRLRTDDMQGFRDMYRVREVFAHELAHCEHDEHNNAFKEVMRWVQRTADGRSWNVGGRRVDDGQSGGFGGGGGDANRLGGFDGVDGGSGRLGGSGGSSRLLREFEEQRRRRRDGR